MTAKRRRVLAAVSTALAAIPACSAATSPAPAPPGAQASSGATRPLPSTKGPASSQAVASAPCRRLPAIDRSRFDDWADASTAPALPVPPVTSGAAPRSLVDACRALEASTARGWATRPVGEARVVPPRCVGGDAGAWIVEHAPFRPVATPDGTVLHHGKWSLVFVGADGRTARGDDARGEIVTGRFGFSGAVDILAVHDFDGDGAAEVLVATSAMAGVDERRRDAVVAFRVRDGRVVRWAPMPSMLAWVDVDGDRTPELFGVGPTSSIGLPRVAHAAPSGGFSFDDDVVRGVLFERCPTPPRGPLRTPLDVACAKAWGESKAAIDARIHAAARGPECTHALLAQLATPGPSAWLVGACEGVPAASSAPPPRRAAPGGCVVD